MNGRRRRGFTIVELLVVLGVVALLAALLMSAVMQAKATARATLCANNLHQIGQAIGQYQAKRQATPSLGTVLGGLGDYLENDRAVWACPEVGTGAAAWDNVSYGVNACIQRMLGSDSGKIVILDSTCDTLEYEGLDRATWEQDLAPRHGGAVTVLYFDGHVERGITPDAFDPYDPILAERNRTNLWRPNAGSCLGEGGCSGLPGGLMAEYRPGRENFSGPAVTRVEKTLSFPFGGQYSNVQLPVFSGANQFSGRWTGRIRPEATGDYTFFISHDDACSVRVNGQLVYEVTGHRWVNWPTYRESTPVKLSQGKCADIEITLVNYDGPTHLDLQWKPPGGERQAIPSQNLFSSQR